MQRMGHRRQEWAAMTDDEILAFYRARYPYVTLEAAKRLHRAEMKWWHLGALAERAKREAAAKASGELKARVFPGVQK